MSKKDNTGEVDKEEIERNYDLIIVFIGYTILLLGVLNGFKKVPEEFLFGTTFAGTFFACSDYHLLKGKFYRKDYLINIIFLFCGVFSFFLLPVILMVFHEIYKEIKPLGDTSTFIALGLVVIGIGLKSNSSKRKFILSMKNDIYQLRNESEETAKGIKLATKELQQIKEDYKSLKENYLHDQERIKELEEQVKNNLTT